MNRIKRILTVFMVFLLALISIMNYSDQVLATNGTQSEAGYVEDDGDDEHYNKMTDKNDLFFDALKESKEKPYNIYTLKRDSVEMINAMSGSIYYPNASYVTVPQDYGTVEFVEFLVQGGDTVKKGQPVAKIITSVDEVSLEEMTRALNRTQEAYNRFVKNQTKGLKEQKAVLDKIKDKQDKKIAELEYEKAQINYEVSKKNMEEEMKISTKKINESRTIKNTTELLATTDGYVQSTSGTLVGENIDSKTKLVKIVDPSSVLFKVADKQNLYKYNMKAIIELNRTINGVEKTIPGRVVASVPDYKADSVNYICYIKPDESVSLADVKDKKISITVQICKMDNVLAVPIRAINIKDTKDGYLLATVNELKDGVLIERNCIPGLRNLDSCQILAGLDEGAQIVIN